jgi:acyl dehydratase
MAEQRIQHLNVGAKFITRPKLVTGTDIDTFGAVTSMLHPLFLSEERVKQDPFAQAVGLKTRVAPGLMVSAVGLGQLLQSGLLDDVVVSMGTDKVRFTAPVYPGDMIHMEIEILSRRETKAGDRVISTYKWEIKNHDDVVVAEGENT